MVVRVTLSLQQQMNLFYCCYWGSVPKAINRPALPCLALPCLTHHPPLLCAGATNDSLSLNGLPHSSLSLCLCVCISNPLTLVAVIVLVVCDSFPTVFSLLLFALLRVGVTSSKKGGVKEERHAIVVPSLPPPLSVSHASAWQLATHTFILLPYL